MEQYNELKALIEKQAAEIADLKNINKQLVNVVQTTMIYDFNDDNMPSIGQERQYKPRKITAHWSVTSKGDWDYPIRTCELFVGSTDVVCMISSFEGGEYATLIFLLAIYNSFTKHKTIL